MAVQERGREQSTEESAAAVKLVDADVHPMLTERELTKLLSPRWRRHIERYGRRAPGLNMLYPRSINNGVRLDAYPEGEGALPGTDFGLLERQLLDEYGVDYAVMNSADLLLSYEEPEFAAEIARTVNQWIVDEWLDKDDRLLGSIFVATEYPDLAVAEIEERATDRRFVQVMLPGSPDEPFGSRKYWPIYEAACAAGLPVATHFSGLDTHRATGWPSYYIEEHVTYALVMESQLINLVADGVFEAFPDLRIISAECGVAWVVALRWALDNAWRQLREDMPRLTQTPSELIHDRVWFTTQPIEEPENEAHFLQAIEHGQLDDRLLFSTDYPHWDFDSPTQALPRSLPKELRHKIFAGNACDLFGLPLTGRRR
jgi:predicted TIM-barrel fold metal-dependent hydrolase